MAEHGADPETRADRAHSLDGLILLLDTAAGYLAEGDTSSADRLLELADGVADGLALAPAQTRRLVTDVRRWLRPAVVGDAGELGREVRELRTLCAIQRALVEPLEPSALLVQALDHALDFTSAERAAILLGDDAGALSVTAARAATGGAAPVDVPPALLEFSRKIAARAIEIARPVVSVDARTDPELARFESVQSLGIRTVVCIPLAAGDERGALYLDGRALGAFGEREVERVGHLAAHAAQALTRARLLARLRQREGELEAALSGLRAANQGLQGQVSQAHAQLAAERAARGSRLVGSGPAMRRVRELLARAAASALPVLLVGESGTGKELAARELHALGPCARGPFVTLNCGAVAPSLLESELFGHVAGAFTGAGAARTGVIASAAGGLLLLDEVEAMPAGMQVGLLRVLETGELRPVGGDRTQPVDVRIVSATNVDPEALRAAGRLRDDLFYRLNGLRIDLPPLRERPEDLPLLLAHLCRELAVELGHPIALQPAARELLQAHTWPGNVRELRHALARAAVLAGAEPIGPTELPPEIAGAAAGAGSRADYERARRRARDEAGRVVDRVWTSALLAAHAGDVAAAAAAVGMPRETLYRIIRRAGVELESFRSARG